MSAHRAGGRGYLRAVVLAASSNVCLQVLGVASGFLVAYFLEPAGRGAYAAALAWSGGLSVIGALGITSSICYFVATERQAAAAVLGTGQRLLLALGICSGVIAVCLTPLLSRGDPVLRAAYLIVFLALPLVFVGGTWMFALQAADLSRWGRVRLVQPIFYVFVLLVLGSQNRLTVEAALGAFVLGVLLQAVVSRSSWRRLKAPAARADHALRRPMLSYGVKSLAAQAPFLLNSRVDQMVLSLTVSLADLGRYAVAVSVTMLVTVLTAAFGVVAMPRIAYQRARGEQARETARVAAIGTLGTGVLGAILVILAAPHVLPLVLNASYQGVYRLIAVLAPGAALLGFNQVLADVLRGYDRALLVARAEGIAGVVTIALLAVLIPRLGILGAAISSTGSYAVATGLMLLAIRRRLRS
ncbi:MAG: polysaccharide biosynthesis C-terminal domain-containing protein [Actinobacteria bacterium]|nr:polysaccharide biosynthesis C-terminal domain-containing protein [Actinomycetota bacterium]